jgi:hypothetical protein
MNGCVALNTNLQKKDSLMGAGQISENSVCALAGGEFTLSRLVVLLILGAHE